LAGSLTGTQLASTLDLSSKTVTLPNTSVTSDQLAGSIANNKLSNSTFTIRGTSRALGDSFSLGVNVDWQSVIVADGSTATTGVAGKGYFINTTSAAHTFTLPASATRGDTIAIIDYAGTFATNKLTIARNGHNIQGVANDSLIGTNRASLVLVYVDSTKGWLYAEEHNVADLQEAIFISATGGTITTSGNFKIHSFTGDGCFVVATLGNPLAGPAGSNVDYLVVAGGGGGSGGGGGGGGAGGYRTTFPSPNCNAGSFPISATTYPVTVGGGGAGGGPTGSPVSGNGSNSVFSTITSTGGGGGGPSPNSPATTGAPGGSGGGARSNSGVPGGTGNTPPVSPPQGNPGGATGGFPNPPNNAGGGGGASQAGGIGTPGGPSAGGNGSANSITGSPITYAGGGGGSQNGPGPVPGGTGGTGGGGAGGPAGTTGTAGTVNLGGGGGGGGGAPPSDQSGGAGGKGIVIIRYKFQ